MKFILTRHTTTEWNLTSHIQGQTDICLNGQGKTEAKQLAKALFGLGISTIVSSDLKRASETAEIINALLNVPLHLEPRLKECSFGEIEGLTKQHAIEKYGDSITSLWEDQYDAYDFRPFGGEHRNGVLARHLEVLDSLVRELPADSTILLVGHGRGMWTLLAGLGLPPEIKKGEYRIVEYNQR